MRREPQGASAETESDRRPEVVLMSTSGCHFCTHAHEVVQRVSGDFPIRVREIDLESVEGAAALRRWRVPFPPIVLVNGQLFGYGRISERKLRRHLQRLGR